MSAEYDNYIHEHIKNLKLGLQWMQDNLTTLDGEKLADAILNANQHDASKWTKEEYDAYDAYFYGKNRTFEVVDEFNKAWLHHIHLNPHHWQHWVLLEDDPNVGSFGKVLEMPLEYVYEMIADWWTFSWKNNNLLEMFNWYQSHRDHMILNAKTRLIVESVLHDIFTILKMQMAFEHPDTEVVWKGIDWAEGPDMLVIAHSDELSDEELKKRKYAFPEERKFPMPDAAHVKSAIRFFNYVDPKDEEKLAHAILERMKEYDMSFDDFGVGDENRFKKYIPKDELEHNDMSMYERGEGGIPQL